jgi:OTU-like cysteine protease
MAYEALNKLHLGHECVISESEPEGAEQRITKRLIIGRLEASPPLRCCPRISTAATTPHSRNNSISTPKSASYKKTALEGGNSLFEAFSTAVWGSPAYHLHLRQLVVDYMRQEPTTEYAAFLGNDFHRYLEYMSQPGVAGDELVLRALADRFGLPITVLTGDEVIWCVRYPARDTWSQREVFLAVAPGARFSAVRRQSAITTLKLTFTGGEDAKAARAVRKQMEAQF